MKSKDTIADWLPWVARAAWLAVALAGGAAVDAAVTDRSDAVRWTATVGGWSIWGVCAAALVIAAVRSLTAIRLLAPLALGATLAAGLGGATAVQLIGLGIPAFVTVAAVFSAEFGRTYVQASAYGDEQRLLLRAPVAAGTAAIVMWTIWAAVLLAGPLLLAARSWVAGAILTFIAVAITALVTPSWHRLSRRWLVFVPAGLVLHDPVVLHDTVMLRTDQVRSIRLAPADTQSADLTGPASGYALEVATSETITAVFAATPQERNGRAIHLSAFLVCPSRPGRALEVAGERRLPVE
jgi:hypothetical protein